MSSAIRLRARRDTGPYPPAPACTWRKTSSLRREMTNFGPKACSRPSRGRTLREGVPRPPPAAPKGRWRCRSDRTWSVPRSPRKRYSRTTESAPRNSPPPPVSGSKPYLSIRSGKLASMISTGVLRTLHEGLAMPSTPSALGPPPVPPGALKAVSTERGRDPVDFALLAFGGGGPVLAHALAEDLGASRVFIPPRPGLFSDHPGLGELAYTVGRFEHGNAQWAGDFHGDGGF